MNALTGIPIEILFALIGALGMIIYVDIRAQLRNLSKESRSRGESLKVLKTYMILVCDKLGIKFSDNS